MTKIINLFGGPGCGKSTTAAGLFHLMKKAEMSVELVTEYAKEKIWEGDTVLADQFYLLAKQNRRLNRLIGKVDYVVTDSPLLLQVHYGGRYGDHPGIVVPAVYGLFDTYENINLFITRTKKFMSEGRLGSEESAIEDDSAIYYILKRYPFDVVAEDPAVIFNFLFGSIND